MSSETRSSSGVRNLRSLFETRSSDTTTPDARGRSPNSLGSSDKENHTSLSKSRVRASFVSVEPAPNMAAAVENASGRRGSFVECDANLALKKSVSQQQDEIVVPEAAVESMPPSAVATPLRPEGEGQLGHDDVPLQAQEREAQNPDKIVTGAEEEPGDMKPADLTDAHAVSGGQALPPVAEDLTASTTSASTPAMTRAQSKKTPVSSKPSAISTKSATKSNGSAVKSPISQPRTPSAVKAPSSISSPAASRPARSSLTAPTAASMARAGPAPEKSRTSPTAAAKPRGVTRPVNLPSHLTAPTASSKAKHDPIPTPSSTAAKAPLAFRPKPQSTTATKPSVRQSLVSAPRPKSRDSQTSTRRSLAAVDGSFLDRMMRPTAASSGKSHEKPTATKSPPRTKPAAKPKTNGHVAPSSLKTAKPNDSGLDDSSPLEADAVSGPTTGANADIAKDVAVEANGKPTGSETPDQRPDELTGSAMEATPAGLGSEATVR